MNQQRQSPDSITKVEKRAIKYRVRSQHDEHFGIDFPSQEAHRYRGVPEATAFGRAAEAITSVPLLYELCGTPRALRGSSALWSLSPQARQQLWAASWACQQSISILIEPDPGRGKHRNEGRRTMPCTRTGIPQRSLHLTAQSSNLRRIDCSRGDCRDSKGAIHV
jgi:hypothetical protein